MSVNQNNDGFLSKSLVKIATCALMTATLGFGQMWAAPGGMEMSKAGIVQQKSTTVTGRVVDENGEAMIGVNVLEKGTSNGTITDNNGHYKLNVMNSKSILIFSYIGYVNQEEVVGNKTQHFITLQEDTKKIDEFVVIGYGMQKKGDVTSAIASVKSDNFTFGNAQDAAQLIKGQVAGLTVSNGSGYPNAESNIVLRGYGTLEGNTTPLILIDGVPGGLTTVAPENIESIDVLKDASAAAIYGTRGANGVIIITTKSGKRDQPTEVSYSTYISTAGFYKQAQFMDASDIKAGKTAFQDLGYNTDWVKAITQTGFTHNHSITLNGGSKNSAYSANLTYRNQRGVIKNTNSEDIKGMVDLTQYMLNNVVKLNLNYQINNHNNNITNATDDGPTNIYRQALIHNPTAPVYKSDGSYYEDFQVFQYYNPVTMLNELKGVGKSQISQLAANLTIEPIRGWKNNLLVSRKTSNGTSESYQTANYSTAIGLNGDATRTDNNSRYDQLELTTNYVTDINKHHLSALAGYSYVYNVNESGGAYNYNFPTDAFLYNNIGAGTALKNGKASMWSGKDDNKLISFFGRVSYGYDNKYNAMLSLRRDGSSEFGVNHKWGLFPSGSVGWTISNETFMKNFTWINNLKLRAGYGVTGQLPGTSYLSLTTYSYGTYYYDNGSWISGLSATTNPNPNLKWEKKAEYNAGLDASFLNDRIGVSIDIYERNSSDILWEYNVPVPPNLYGSTLANVGKMRNSGMEVAINLTPVKLKDFEWKTIITGSHNNNKLINLSNDLYQSLNYYETGYLGDPVSMPTQKLEVGKSLGNFFGLKSVGLSSSGLWMIENPATGKAEEFNANMLNDNYYQYLGNGIPKLILGWRNTFRYKGFDMNISFNGQFGYKILNQQRLFYANNSIAYNRLKSAADVVYGVGTLSSSQPQTFVSYYLENGDFLKLNSMTLGYTFNTSRIKFLNRVRAYVTGENLFCLTGYKGLDPELTNGNKFSIGNDPRDKYPTIRSFTFGLNITLK